MSEECLICGAPLHYLEKEEPMECAICHKKENSRTGCAKGHYVCNECHTRGMDQIIGICLAEKSKDPVSIMNRLMSQPFCHMHGPEHHVMVGSALLTAYHNAGGRIGEIGGPRCCKRDSFLSILAAVDFVEEHLGIKMEKSEIVCEYSHNNNQCIGKRCPFSKEDQRN